MNQWPRSAIFAWLITPILSITLWFVFISCIYGAVAELSWEGPNTYEDGSYYPPEERGGVRVYWGVSSGSYDETITLNDGGLQCYRVSDLLPDTSYYFVATAFSIFGFESAYSNEVIKVTPSDIPIPEASIADLYSNMNLYDDKIVGKKAYKNLMLRNHGIFPITIDAVEVSGSDYYITSKFPKIVDPGKTISFRVYFQPVAIGLRLGVLTVKTDAGDISKPLSGNGK